ncbi:hypothetical protein QJS66_23320 (plasmid) [Kocuria rhizophila]|nr:hypothetical protein QJS66_23320 [Kocuria rhizophila]
MDPPPSPPSPPASASAHQDVADELGMDPPLPAHPHRQVPGTSLAVDAVRGWAREVSMPTPSTPPPSTGTPTARPHPITLTRYPPSAFPPGPPRDRDQSPLRGDVGRLPGPGHARPRRRWRSPTASPPAADPRTRSTPARHRRSRGCSCRVGGECGGYGLVFLSRVLFAPGCPLGRMGKAAALRNLWATCARGSAPRPPVVARSDSICATVARA